ncbi:hypothetical protein KY284_032065 [Solanum tuberosum]|nr:hypothetical protein KY284_032065 [Solanum tuberosum]
MDFSGRVNGLGIKLLNQSNYKVWKTCMEPYLVGEDMWDVVNGNDTSPPTDRPENSSAYKKWKQVNAKAKFILKRTISSGLFDHIIKCKSAHEIWRTLDCLFNKKNEARLQILENELASTTQGWAQQPSLEEFENLLSSQELLANQLASVFVKDGEGDALVADKRNFKGKTGDMPHSQSSGGSRSPREKEEPSKYCRAKESNMAQKVAEEEEEWGNCLVAEARAIDAMISINLDRDWIEDLESRI